MVTGELLLVPVEAVGTGHDPGHHGVALVAKATLDIQGAVAGVGVVSGSVLEGAAVAQICAQRGIGREKNFRLNGQENDLYICVPLLRGAYSSIVPAYKECTLQVKMNK